MQWKRWTSCSMMSHSWMRAGNFGLANGFPPFFRWWPLIYNRTGLGPKRRGRKMAGIWECLLMKLPADQYYLYIFVCLKSQRCSSHSRIRQYSSVFVTFNWPRMTSGKKYWSSSPVLLYVDGGDYQDTCIEACDVIIHKVSSAGGTCLVFVIDSLKFN